MLSKKEYAEEVSRREKLFAEMLQEAVKAGREPVKEKNTKKSTKSKK